MIEIDNKPLVVKLEFGSHLYGLDTPQSDRDYKGIVLPTARDILLGNTSFHISKSTGNDGSKNTSDDVDTEYFSLQRFIELACKGETVALDMLHSRDHNIDVSTSNLWIWDFIQLNKNYFYTKSMKAYIGYVRKQAAKYSVKGSRLAALEEAMRVISDVAVHNPNATLQDIQERLPLGEHTKLIETEIPHHQKFYEVCGRKFQLTNYLPYVIDRLNKIYDNYGERAKMAKNNEGVDWKAVSHALRAGYQARAIYQKGAFIYPLNESEYLREVKAGVHPYIDVKSVLEALVDEVEELSEKSDYPEKVNKAFFDNVIIDIHRKIVIDASSH